MMKNYAKVEGYPNLLRDLDTNAIVNTDKISLDNYTLAKKNKEREEERIDTIENNITELKSSIDEIKQLLRRMVNESQ